MTTANIEIPVNFLSSDRLPNRDEFGFVNHPDINFLYDALKVKDEGNALNSYLELKKFEYRCVFLESDACEEISDKYFKSDSYDCSFWIPTPPEGEGWLLGWITDCDDGPCAVYLRKGQ